MSTQSHRNVGHCLYKTKDTDFNRKIMNIIEESKELKKTRKKNLDEI